MDGLISEIVDYILDANIPKKVKKKVDHDSRILHVGDVDTRMEDEEIYEMANKFKSVIVTHDREFAYRIKNKEDGIGVLYIKNDLSAEEISECIDKHREVLNHQNILCFNGKDCMYCYSPLGSRLREKTY